MGGNGRERVFLHRIIAAAFLLTMAYALRPAGSCSERLPLRADQDSPIRYHLETIPHGVSGLERRFKGPDLLLLEKLNRCDLIHLAREKTIVIPDRFVADELIYSPLPAFYSWCQKCPKLLIVYQPDQVFGAYANGRLLRWGPLSSGRKAYPTPTGLFHLNWKARVHVSTENPKWVMPWYFNFANFRGLAIHAYSMPCRPASHACVRLLTPDAVWIWKWGEQWQLGNRPWIVLKEGTPMLIIGNYDFSAPPPWRSSPGKRVILPVAPDLAPR